MLRFTRPIDSVNDFDAADGPALGSYLVHLIVADEFSLGVKSEWFLVLVVPAPAPYLQAWSIWIEIANGRVLGFLMFVVSLPYEALPVV